MEDKVKERKLVKMLLKTYFSRIQGYIYPHIVAVMSLYLVFVGHSLQCLSKTTTILHQSISSVKVKVILGEKIVGPNFPLDTRYKEVHSFGHIPVKFHCDGSIF